MGLGVGLGEGVSDGVTPASNLGLDGVAPGVRVELDKVGLLAQAASTIAIKPAMIRFVFISIL